MKNAKCKSLTVLLTALSMASLNTGWSKSSVEHKIKDGIDSIADALNEQIDKLGEDKDALQNYLSNYSWKGIIQDHATSSPATLKDLKMNGHHKAVVVSPGQKIEGEVMCDLDRDKCSAFSIYRVVVGIKGEGAQTTIGNEAGIVAGESREKFHLHAPKKPGLYEVRFKVVTSLLEKKAIESWTDGKGNEPDASTTIGLILVRK